MTVAIFGARGFIGRHLVAWLSRRHKVYEFSSSQNGVFDPETGLICGGVEIPSGCDVVLYLSQSPHYRSFDAHSEHVKNVNAVSAGIIAQRAKAAGAKKFFYASSGNVYQPTFARINELSLLNSFDGYALSKIEGERAVSAHAGQMQVLALRIFGVFGPGQKGMLVQKIFEKIVAREPIVLEKNPNDPADDKGLKISYLYVRDFARIVESLMSQDLSQSSVPLNVAGPQDVSLAELAREISGVVKIRPLFEFRDRARNLDLRADIAKLSDLTNLRFTPIETALSETFNSTLQMKEGIL